MQAQNSALNETDEEYVSSASTSAQVGRKLCPNRNSGPNPDIKLNPNINHNSDLPLNSKYGTITCVFVPDFNRKCKHIYRAKTERE